MTRVAFDGPVRTLGDGTPRAGGIEAAGAVVARLGKCGGEPLPSGAVVVPGFVDSHLHLLSSAAARLSVDCSPGAVSTIAEMLDALRAARPSGGWVRAHGYDDAWLAERRHPTTAELDVVDAPCAVHHATGHVVALNSAARRALGMAHDDGPAEAASVAGRTPALDRAALLASLRDVGDELARHGVTGVCDATVTNGPAELELLAGARLAQRLTAMVGAARLGDASDAGMRFGGVVGRVRVGHAKLYVDDDDTVRDVTAQVEHAHARGWPVALHALDVGPMDSALGALGSTAPPRDTFDRIEHAALCLPEQAQRVAASGAVVVTQPSFVTRRGGKYLDELSEVERGWLYPVRTLLRCGVRVAASSDAPVVAPRPLDWIDAAVTREIGPRERVGRASALRMATTTAAEASLQPGGTLRPGGPADFVVLSDDPLVAQPRDVAVLVTVIGGRVVYDGR